MTFKSKAQKTLLFTVGLSSLAIYGSQAAAIAAIPSPDGTIWACYMQLDVLLCDHGQVSGDKLFVSGGGIDRMYVPDGSGPYVVNFSVAGDRKSVV